MLSNEASIKSYSGVLIDGRVASLVNDAACGGRQFKSIDSQCNEVRGDSQPGVAHNLSQGSKTGVQDWSLRLSTGANNDDEPIAPFLSLAGVYFEHVERQAVQFSRGIPPSCVVLIRN